MLDQASRRALLVLLLVLALEGVFQHARPKGQTTDDGAGRSRLKPHLELFLSVHALTISRPFGTNGRPSCFDDFRGLGMSSYSTQLVKYSLLGFMLLWLVFSVLWTVTRRRRLRQTKVILKPEEGQVVVLGQSPSSVPPRLLSAARFVCSVTGHVRTHVTVTGRTPPSPNIASPARENEKRASVVAGYQFRWDRR